MNAGKPKKNPKWYEARLQRDREFRALLERRKALDEELEAKRPTRAAEQE